MRANNPYIFFVARFSAPIIEINLKELFLCLKLYYTELLHGH